MKIAAASTTRKSSANRNMPTVMKLNRRCTIRAIMSDPPVVAPPRRIRPSPMPSTTPPNSVPSSGSSLTDFRGRISIRMVNIAVATRLRKANTLPIVRYPIRNSGMFSTRAVIPTGHPAR